MKVSRTQIIICISSQQLPIKKDEDSLTLTNYHWGLVPKWSEKMTDFRPLNNARLETLMEKRTFSGLIQSQRCFGPADGYYEWKMKKAKISLLFEART